MFHTHYVVVEKSLGTTALKTNHIYTKDLQVTKTYLYTNGYCPLLYPKRSQRYPWVSGPTEHFKKYFSSESFENFQECYLFEIS